MRIVFISGSFEPESGGVADYCRLLASQCLSLGHDVACVSVHDRFAPQVIRSNDVLSDSEMPVLRLPESLPWSEKVPLVQEFLQSFGPDWLSLQFVCYAYQKKGIVYPQIRFFRKMFRDYPLHIMFHETWIGALDSDGLKQRAIGALQKFSVHSLCQSLKPAACSANILPYVDQLSKLGLNVEHLPLFGNVSIRSENADGWLFEKLHSLGVPISSSSRDKFLLAGIFGSLHFDEWQLEPLLRALKVIGEKSGRVPVLILIGRRAEDLKNSRQWCDAFENSDLGVSLIDIGAWSSSKVSEFLNSIDLGIATTTIAKIEKSGAFIAMLEHGLPVLSVNSKLNFRSASANIRPRIEGLYLLEEVQQVSIDTLLRRRDNNPRIEQVADKFIQILSRGPNAGTI